MIRLVGSGVLGAERTLGEQWGSKFGVLKDCANMLWDVVKLSYCVQCNE